MLSPFKRINFFKTTLGLLLPSYPPPQEPTEHTYRETWANKRKINNSMLRATTGLVGKYHSAQPPKDLSHSLVQSVRLARKDFVSVRRFTSPSDSSPVAVMASNGEGVKGPEGNGFDRSEMFTSKLVGTVKKYDAHIFAVTDKDVLSWPKSVEQPEVSMLAAKLGAALKGKKGQIPRNVKFTLLEGKETANNVFILPDQVLYKNLSPDEAETFVKEVLVEGKPTSLTPEPLVGDQIMVCCHNLHDVRCGVCGPILVTEFRKVIKERNLDTVVWPCSHIGGHKFAGNLIAYTKGPDGSVAGNWYGYVTPADVPALLDSFQSGKVLDKLWRGAMGIDEKEQEVQQKSRLDGEANGGCGASCACVPQEKVRSVWYNPTSWDSSAKQGAALALAVVALGVAYYVRSQAVHQSAA